MMIFPNSYKYDIRLPFHGHLCDFYGLTTILMFRQKKKKFLKPQFRLKLWVKESVSKQ